MGRRSVSAGAAPPMTSPAPKAPSGSLPNGGEDDDLTRDYFRVEDLSRPPLLALPRRPLRPRDDAPALVFARGVRVTRLRRACRHHQFLLPARRLASGGAGRGGGSTWACRHRGCRPQHARRRRPRPYRGEGGRASAMPSAAASSSATGRPTSSPGRPTAPPMAGSAGCSPSATAAPRRANAISISPIFSTWGEGMILGVVPGIARDADDPASAWTSDAPPR